ncbi:MAG: metallophosphoesterase [Verrucomicrobiota bacterium]
MKQGIVVSDLHLFASRSDGEEKFSRLSGQLAEVDALVLNGDIFDFRWALIPHKKSVPLAAKWLEDLRSEFPHLEIHFIPGNHDCLPAFLEILPEIPGIDVHSHHLLLGTNLFLHGDATTRRMNLDEFHQFRTAWEEDQPRGNASAQLYHLSDATGLTELTHRLWFGGGAALRRLIWHLDAVVPSWRDKVDDTFYGHTHLDHKAVEKQGIRFHNTGSALRRSRFVPAVFEYEDTPTVCSESHESSKQ